MHVPAGATPKDGPSAGITMVTALASLATGRPVRSEVGMTGEVTLNGRVLPIGGLKQKLLAAQRNGLTEVFVPLRNEPDLDDVPAEVLEALTVHVVGDVLDVVRQGARPTRLPRRRSRPDQGWGGPDVRTGCTGGLGGAREAGGRGLAPRAVAPLAAVVLRDVVGALLELAELRHVEAAQGALGVAGCQVHGPGGHVDTAAGHDAPDAEALAALHAPVVRQNAVGRHGSRVLSTRPGRTP